MRRRLSLVLVVWTAAAAAGCSGRSAATGSAGSGGGSGGAGGAVASDGATLYATLCASCHGDRAQGVTGPSLRAWTRGRAELVGVIDARMPLGAPDKCDAGCAARVADHVLGALQGPIACGGMAALPPRRLRLLTREEYRRTVADLLGGGGAACRTRTFTFDAGGRSLQTVHVAGSFNGWAPTIAAGGWAMQRQGNAWTLTRELPAGMHRYKLVLDERDWVTDPAALDREPDGFGGQNGVLTVACGSGGDLGFDPAARLPVETRPEGFAFSSASDTQVVTSVYAEEALAAARRLAAAATSDLPALLGCDPAAAACAGQFVRSFGARAFRRPLSDAEVARYTALYSGRGDAKKGAAAVVTAMLASPAFLYRAEIGERQADGTYKLGGFEVASALSYFAWGTMPDAALFEAARRGDLGGAAGIERELRRLLADPRARPQVGRFALEWLGAEKVLGAQKNPALYPDFTDGLKASLAEETRRFVAHVIFDSTHTFGELLTADYTLLDGAAARHYGLPAPASDWDKVPYGDGRRAGLLGHASILASTAHSDQSSPIQRGLFVRRALLCEPLPPPPPNAGGVPPVDPGATTRERFRMHTASEFCRSCHQYIDPVGFGFERFDAVGRWRETENGRPIDASGDMTDVEQLGAGTHAPFDGLPQLARTIADSRAAKACFAKKAHEFAHGASLTAGDTCTLEPVLARFAESNWDLRELLVAIALAPDFVRRAP